jgi:hypothetical protein
MSRVILVLLLTNVVLVFVISPCSYQLAILLWLLTYPCFTFLMVFLGPPSSLVFSILLCQYAWIFPSLHHPLLKCCNVPTQLHKFNIFVTIYLLHYIFLTPRTSWFGMEYQLHRNQEVITLIIWIFSSFLGICITLRSKVFANLIHFDRVWQTLLVMNDLTNT